MKIALPLTVRHAGEFLFWVFVAMFTIYGVLSFFDITPNVRPLDIFFPSATTTSAVVAPEQAPETPAPAAPLPKDGTPARLIIDKLEKTLPINNPESTDLTVLDNSLLTGVARYPGSATMKDDGTMLIFGHSSYLAVVHNQNYRAFNGIQNLVWGDLIRVQSDDYEYVYRVDSVTQLKATADSIPLQHTVKQLVLVTCNTFGAKEDRYIVEASFVDSYPIQ